MTKSVYDVRLANLRRLMAQWGGPTSLSRKLGHSNGSFLGQLAGPNPRRVISEKVARSIEQAVNLPAGSLDQEHAGAREPIRDELLALCVQAVAAAVQDADVRPAPEAFAELVALAYEHAREHDRVDEGHIIRLVRLVR